MNRTANWLRLLHMWSGPGNAIKHEIHINISTYHAIPRQILSYTMPCPPGHTIYHVTSPCHTIYHAMLARRYHITCHISLGHTICYNMPGRPYPIPCQTLPGHTINHAMPTRPYHILCRTSPDHMIYYAIPEHYLPCYTCQTTPYIMPCPLDHTKYHDMPARTYHIPC